MGKIMIFTVTGNEEHIISDIQKYLKLNGNYADVSSMQNAVLIFSNLEIDLYYREIRQKGKVIRFTDLEFRLFLYLARQPGRVFTYQQIYDGVWGEEYVQQKGNIMSHIHHIRKKIETDGRVYIENIRGVGYRFIKQ